MKKFLNVFIGLILVLLLCVYNVYKSIGDSISSDSIHQNVNNNLFSGFIYDDNGDYSDIFMSILDMTNIDEDTVIKLMKNNIVDKNLTDVVNSIYDYRLSRDESYKYSGDYIISLVEDNMDQVLFDINYNLSSEDREYVINYLHDNIDDIVYKIYDMDIGGYTR